MASCLRLLGVPEFERDGARCALAPVRRYQLAAYLAYRADWVARDLLAELFYAERGNDAARSNLRKVLLQLRADPWFAASVEEHGAALRLLVDTDVAQLNAAASAQDAQRVAALYRGPLFEGFDVGHSAALSEWARFERERLHSIWRDAVLHLLDEGSGTTLLAARLLAADPLDEAVVRAHMRQLARLGQRTAALLAYRDFAARVGGRLGVEPSRETRTLSESIRGAPAETAWMPAPALDAGFIGRSAELRQLAALFAQPDCRLVTIVGPGGVGKSRLAQQAMPSLAIALADGATFVPLEDLARPADIGARIARQLPLQLAGMDPPHAQVVRHLQRQQRLLVLDNFEHLAGAVGLVAGLLAQCPKVVLVVTSRTRLGLEREWLLPLDGLPFPAPEDDDRAEAFDAVRLFAAHAQRARPSFALADECTAVGDICRLVDGLPLAIEIAAAWTRMLPCRTIAGEIRVGTELLRSDDPARASRQASIEATFEHSWRLLANAEREVLPRLAVFRDGFTREAAAGVAGAALPLLAALVDKSLVRAEAGRFGLHPLIQQMAAARLAERGETERAAQLHFDFFARRLQRIGSVRGADGLRALAEIEPDLGNILAAWDWGVQHRRSDMLAAAGSLARLFQVRGRFDEGLHWLEAAESGFDAGEPALCQVRVALANLEYRVGRYDDSERHARMSLQALRLAGDPRGVMSCLNMLGATALQSGRFEESARHFDEALQLARADRDRDSETAFLQNLAQALQQRGDYDAALLHTHAALALARQRGDRELQLIALNNLGNLQRSLKRPVQAVSALTEALALAAAAEIRSYRTAVLTNLALAQMDLREFDAARGFAQKAADALRDGGEPSLACLLHCVLGRIATARGAFDEAAREFASAIAWCRSHGYMPGTLHAVVVSAERLIALGEPDQAARYVALALRHPATERTDAEFARELAQRHQLSLDAAAFDAAADAALLDTVTARILASA